MKNTPIEMKSVIPMIRQTIVVIAALSLSASLLHSQESEADSPTSAPKTGEELYEFEWKMMDLPDKADIEQLRRIGGEGLDELVAKFASVRKQQIESGASSGEPLKLAILPVHNDISGGYFTRRLEDLISQQGPEIECVVVTRDPAVRSALAEEIAMGDRKGKIMDAATIKTFGQIQGVDAMVIAQAYEPIVEQTRTEMRIGLKVFRVGEGTLIWGDDLTKEEVRSLTFIEFFKKYQIPIFILIGLFVAWRISRAISNRHPR